MQLNGKGQGVAIDFLFAVLVFLLLLNAIMILIENSNKNVAEKGLLSEMNSTAIETIDRLVRTKGVPNNWEQKDISETLLIGVAKGDRALDEEKLEKFVEWTQDYRSLDYNSVKTLLLIGSDYYFSLEDSSGNTIQINGVDVSSELPTNSENVPAVNVKRIVNFNGEEAIAQLTLYYPR